MGHFCSITRPQNGSLLRYRNQQGTYLENTRSLGLEGQSWRMSHMGNLGGKEQLGSQILSLQRCYQHGPLEGPPRPGDRRHHHLAWRRHANPQGHARHDPDLTWDEGEGDHEKRESSGSCRKEGRNADRPPLSTSSIVSIVSIIGGEIGEVCAHCQPPGQSTMIRKSLVCCRPSISSQFSMAQHSVTLAIARLLHFVFNQGVIQ